MDFTQLPVGFGMALAMNPTAMNVYSAMTEQQKQAVLDQAHRAQSRSEMHRIVNSLARNRMQ